MGTWTTGGFDNDDAADWIWELAEAEDVSILKDVLATITDSEDYLEAPDCAMAIAAAEVVAAMNKKPAARLPDEVRAFLARVPDAPAPELIESALLAIERIRNKSELQVFWDETGNPGEWYRSLDDLESRLQ